MTTTRLKTLLLAICVGGSASIAGAQTIDPIVEVGKQRTAAAKASQAKIDRLADETASLLTDYKTVMKQVDGLKVYNARLERQIANQEKRIRDIDASIAEASVIQRQIPPLVTRMLDGWSSSSIWTCRLISTRAWATSRRCERIWTGLT